MPNVRCERGFTLLETIVTLAIAATLVAAGGIWMLGRHPGAIAQAAGDYDAALGDARAIAAGGEGATLVFAPRIRGGRAAPGFTLRVYRGRPAPGATVAPTTAMPLVSDASVSEKTLGPPPFSIFIGASEHVSGASAYPHIRADGSPTFPEIAREPACPSGGFVLRFSAPPQARQTRSLACSVTPPGVPGPPNPSPTPNVPTVTPAELLYHWPADAGQTLTATEWGYTHWFAAGRRFCVRYRNGPISKRAAGAVHAGNQPSRGRSVAPAAAHDAVFVSQLVWRQHKRRSRGVSAQPGRRRHLHRDHRRRLRANGWSGRPRHGLVNRKLRRLRVHASFEARTQAAGIGLSR